GARAGGRRPCDLPGRRGDSAAGTVPGRGHLLAGPVDLPPGAVTSARRRPPGPGGTGLGGTAFPGAGADADRAERPGGLVAGRAVITRSPAVPPTASGSVTQNQVGRPTRVGAPAALIIGFRPVSGSAITIWSRATRASSAGSTSGAGSSALAGKAR